jgi:ATP synthase protein I
VSERDEQRGEDKSEEEKRQEEWLKADQSEQARLRDRLDKLSTALDAHQDQSAATSGPDASGPTAGSFGSAMNLGFRVLSEFVAAIVVGALIGWQLDAWIGATPLFLIVFLLIGTAAGFWNVYRIAVKPPGADGGRG